MTETFIHLHRTCSVAPSAGYTPLGRGDGTRGLKLSAFGSFRFVVWCVHVGGWRKEGGGNLLVREKVVIPYLNIMDPSEGA